MNYKNTYRAEVRKRLGKHPHQPAVTVDDIRHLPRQVQQYLEYAGAIGKPAIANLRAVWSGSMKRNMKSDWMAIHSLQHNFFDEPARLFYIHARVMGIPFEGLHLYAGTGATMQIKVASLFRVVNARGDMMSRGETVTVFNDMCFLAPSALISKNIGWEVIDDLKVKATYTNRNITVSAVLTFNAKGELVDFISEDRYYCEDGKTYLSYPWSTPIRDYAEIEGRKVPTYGEALWHKPEGAFCYAKFELKEIGFNVDFVNASDSLSRLRSG